MSAKIKTTQIPKSLIGRTTHMTACLAWLAGAGFILLWGFVGSNSALANPHISEPVAQHRDIPILGITLNHYGKPMGVVVHVEIGFEERVDQEGLQIRFHTQPGNFSQLSQQAVGQAIIIGAHVAGLHPNSWTVTLVFPYKGVTLYGDSLSAMVGLSVVALAKGDPLLTDRVLTGTITPKGKIGLVGGVPFKIYAAHAGHFQRVLIPEERDVRDGDWQTPFLMQVSPVGTVSKAYLALTGQLLHPPHIQRPSLIAHFP